MLKNTTLLFIFFLIIVFRVQAQQLIGNTWIIERNFLTKGVDTANLYVRNGAENIFDLSHISMLFKPSNTYTGTAVESSQQTGTWSLDSMLTLDGEPGDYLPIGPDKFLVSSPFFMLDTASGQFNIPAQSHFLFTSLTVGLPVTVTAKVFLQGPYVSSAQLMHDSLRVQNRIPLTEPYSGISGFTHTGGGGGEQTTPAVLSVTGPNAIVDWVFLEFRGSTDPALVLATRSALLQRDGDVVDVDGVSSVHFVSGVNAASYFLTIRHRNHLGVQLGATKFYPFGVGIATNFGSLPPEGFYAFNGLNAAQKTVGSVFTLWAGNARTDFQLKYNGSNNDRTSILSVVGLATPNAIISGYNLADFNLDGVVKYNGSNNDRNVLLLNVGISTPSAIIHDQVAH